MGKSSDDIKHVKIRTQNAAVLGVSHLLRKCRGLSRLLSSLQIRIIDKKGPLHNFADR